MEKKTEYQYDVSGSLTAVKDPAVLAEPSIPPVTRDYYPNGQLKQIADKLGRTTYYFYEDLHLNLTRVVDPLGGETKYAYDGVGRRVSMTNAKGYTTQYEYDLNNNVEKTTDPLGRQTVNEYDKDNLLIKTIDSANHATESSYDEKGQQISVKDANGQTENYAYDALGRITSITDKAGRTTAYEYDCTGNLAKIITSMGTTISFEYDANGNLTKTTDARGKQTQNAFTVMDQLTETDDPLGYATQYLHRKDGNIEKRQDAKGLWTTYNYNLLGQLIDIDYASDPASHITIEYYDNGYPKKMTDSAGTTSYGYDANDRLISVTDPYGKMVSYAYDILGNRTAITYPEGLMVTYEYDAVNRLAKVTDWLGGETSYIYDAAGNLAAASYPNGTITEYTYDSANRLTGIMHKRSDASVLCSFSYTLDPVGNITHLVVANEPLSPIYESESSFSTYDDGNRLVSDGKFVYTFDNNGNLVQRAGSGGTITFTYNHENMLTGLSSGASTIANVYSGSSQRIARTHNGTQTRFVLDVAASVPGVLAETDSSGVVQAYYVYGLGLISRITPSGWRQIYHFNDRGDTIAMTDKNQAVTDAYAYDEFGKKLNRTGSTQNPFTFVGKFGVMDEGDGFYFMGERYYDSGVGRFLSEDPSDASMEDINLYHYAKSNPLVWIDPDGCVVAPLSNMQIGGYDYGKEGAATRYKCTGYAKHNGVDLVAKSGEIVLAPEDGEIYDFKWNTFGGGYMLYFKGKSGYHHIFGHLRKDSKLLEKFKTNMKGNRPKVEVKEGKKLAKVGPRYDGEVSSGPHLHYSVYSGDPAKCITVDPKALWQKWKHPIKPKYKPKEKPKAPKK